MKNFISLLVLSIIGFLANAQEMLPFDIEYSFDGYSHEGSIWDRQVKAYVFMDGEEVLRVKPHPLSKPQKISLEVDEGSHLVKVEMWVFREGEWKLLSLENNCAIDGWVEEEFEITGNGGTLEIIFDLNRDVVFVYTDK